MVMGARSRRFGMTSMRIVSQRRERVICIGKTCSFDGTKGCGVREWSKMQSHVTPPSAEGDEIGGPRVSRAGRSGRRPYSPG
jgi:hypothetical protein